MIDYTHDFPVVRPAQFLDISRASVGLIPAAANIGGRRRNQVHRIYPSCYAISPLTARTRAGRWTRRTFRCTGLRPSDGGTRLGRHDVRALGRLSNGLTLDASVDALEEVVLKYGPPEIMNMDQGSQFTSSVFIGYSSSRASGATWTANGA